MTNEIYEDIPQRIANIYHSCSAQEQSILRDILTELSETGESKTYNDVWLTDFKEIPVSIGEFLCSPQYLGETNRQGDSVYPFWKHTMTDIFSAGNKYNEIILSGATRIGKTSTAVSMLCYMLYLLMLYREPHEYFHKKEISKFSIVFANLTKDLAAGIAFREFNDTLKLSPWFNEHGTFTRSDRNFYYVPEGNCVEIIAVSDATQALGRQVWACVVGDTKIVTSDGIHSIEDLAGKHIFVKQYDFETNHVLYAPADVILTKYVTDTIRITMDDGTVIEGTPDHRVMLSDGSYIQLQSLTSGDVLMSSEHNAKVQIVDFAHYGSPIPVYDVVNAGELHNFIVSGCTELVLHNCFIDEVNFAKSGIKDISKAKSHMKNLYDTVNARISGTFRLNGEVYGKLITASSKNTDSDFLSEHIETQLSSGNEHLYLVDRPQWEVLPPDMFSGDKFHFTVGDRYKRGFVVPKENDDEDHLQEYIKQGYKVIAAPEELRKNFIADYDISLRDIAGISIIGAMGFITQDIVTPCIAEDRKNPFYADVLEIGTQDNDTIESHFHVNEVSRRLMQCPMAIHCDLAEVNDLAGISGVVVDGSKVIETLDGKKVSFPFLRQIFVTGIKAPRGDRISFQKIINYLIWLRKTGFNIISVSTDQYQSSYFREMLNQMNFATEKISVDASLEPYIGLKSMLNDQRIELVKCQRQEDELVNLQRYNNRIDHPENGCFTGDTKVRLVDGRSLSILELMEEQSYRDNWVYTFNEITQRIEPKRIKKVFQTKLTSELVKVTLDNGDSVICTPEHRFMLRDGSYAEIRSLSAGDSLMPLYTKTSQKGLKGYRLYYEPMQDSWHYEHRQFCNISEFHKGWVVHHCNYSKVDNCPTNLRYMPRDMHISIHNNNTMDYSVVSESVKNWHRKMRGTEAYRLRSEHLSESIKAHNYVCKYDEYLAREQKQQEKLHNIAEVEKLYGVDWNTLSPSKKGNYMAKYLRSMKPAIPPKPKVKKPYVGLSPEQRASSEQQRINTLKTKMQYMKWFTDGKSNIYIDIRFNEVPDGFYSGRVISQESKDKRKRTVDNWTPEFREKMRQIHSDDTASRMWITNGIENKYIHKDSEIPEGFCAGRTIHWKNHKIEKIEFIHMPCRVYDLEIEDNHNFALDCGVFVHNSKDEADSLCGAAYNLIQLGTKATVRPKTVANAIAAINGINSRSSSKNPYGFNPFGEYRKY